MVVVINPSEGKPSMGKSITELSSVTRVGLDLAKNAFQVHGVDAKGEVVVSRKLRRRALAQFFAKLAPCVVAMEACSSAHHWGGNCWGITVHYALCCVHRYSSPMARLARVVVHGLPYHVTQRGNGRRRVFFADPDYAAYRDWLAEAAHEARVTVWAWCLMSNHVHLILVPQDEDGLRRALARVHRRYAGLIHARRRRTGHFWQGRYGAVAMDEDHLAAAYRYVNLNPVRARLVERAEDWPWSSARALLGLAEDGLTDLAPARQRFSRFGDLLEADEEEEATARLRKGESVGRPVGSDTFLAALETKTRRRLHALKRGPKPKDDGATAAAK